MFEDVKKDDQRVTSGPSPTEDMFSEVDPTKTVPTPVKPSAVDQGIIQPVGQTPDPKTDVGPAQPLQNLREVMDDSVGVKPSVVKKILIWLVSVAVIVGVGWGGYYAYVNYIAPAMNKPDTTQPVDNTNSVNNNQPVDTNTAPVNNTNTAPTTDQPSVVIDSDNDGLSDIEEQQLGTDVNNPDTDKDGLTDYEEVKIYNTDPLNPDTDNDGLIDREEVITWHTNPKSADTDGDGFQDGVEVNNGFNPNGPGKLTPDQLPVNGTVK